MSTSFISLAISVTLSLSPTTPCGCTVCVNTPLRSKSRSRAPRAAADAFDAGQEPLEQLGLFASLRARTLELDGAVAQRWREAEPASSVPLALSDWIRRLALDWPLVACGTASGGLAVGDLATGELLATSPTAHPGRVDSAEVAAGMRLLYADHDGGGLTAVAMRGSRLASAGRDGGVKLWRLDGDELVPLGAVAEGVLVSAIELAAEEEGPLWVAGLDSVVRRYDSPFAFAERAYVQSSVLDIRCGAAVLDIATCDELGLVACATAAGAVELAGSACGTPRGTWKPFGATMEPRPYKGCRARSVALLRGATGWSVVAGGSDGGIQRRRLAPRSDEAAAEAFDESLPAEPLTPPHGGPVVSLTPVGGAGEGLLLSGAHDGTLRVWEVGDGVPGGKALYGLGGYKVWLGSVCSDGRRIVSDGNDNRVHVHDFSAAPL